MLHLKTRALRSTVAALALSAAAVFTYARPIEAPAMLASGPVLLRRKNLYAEISKYEEQDDGTVKVWGYASSNAVDSDGETITTDAMKNALPDYMKFGAVREMHQPLAAGTAIEASIEEETGKTFFGAHVVDPVACKKVLTNVYKGFSIGGKVTERDPADKKVIKGLKLVEVSLVDRPANPEAVFTVAKAASTPEEDVEDLAEILNDGVVTPAQIIELIKAHKTQVEGTGSTGAPPQGGVQPGTGTTPEPEGAAKAEGTDLQKGMYTVSNFASLLQSVSYLIQDTCWEAEYEGDNSPLPAALQSWLKDGLKIFQDMVQEETAELVATLTTSAEKTEKFQAAQGDVVQKAGRRFSKATKEALGKVHKACKEADEHLTGMKYDADDVEEEDDTGKAARTDDTNGIAKAEEVQDMVNKAVSAAIAPLNEALEKARKDNEDLQAKVTEMGKRAAPGKALLSALALSKAEDTVRDNETRDNAPPPEGTNARAVWEMNKALRGGRVQ